MKDLESYRNINKNIADATLKTLSRHLWYLSDILLGLSFFDNRHSEETLQEMAAALKKEPSENLNMLRNKSVMVTRDQCMHINVSNIKEMISSNTLKFFNIVLGCNEQLAFLERHPSTWNQDAQYTQISDIVKTLTTVNDPAERAIGLLKGINNTLAIDQDQQNHLIQVIELYNKNHPNSNKATIVQNLKKN